MRGGFTRAWPWPPPFTRYVGANQKPSRLGPSVEMPRKHFGSPDSCAGLEAMLSSEWKKPNSTVLSVTPRRRQTFPAAVGRLHDVEQAEAVEGRPIDLVPVGEVTDRLHVADRGGDHAAAVIPLRVVGKRPAVDVSLGREAFQAVASGFGVALGGET